MTTTAALVAGTVGVRLVRLGELRRMGLSAYVVRNAVRAKKLRPVRTNGPRSKRLFRLSEVLDFMRGAR